MSPEVSAFGFRVARFDCATSSPLLLAFTASLATLASLSAAAMAFLFLAILS